MPDSQIGFAGGDAFVYRLTLTTQGFVDHLYPLAVPRAAPGRVEAVGWNIDDSARWLEVDPGRRRQIRRWSHSIIGSWPMRARSAWRTIRPRSRSSRTRRSRLKRSHFRRRSPARIDPPRDQDVYRFTARKGEKWLIRVESRSLGHPLDAVLRVLDSAGKVLTEVDDPGSRRRSTTRDPELTFTPAADGTYRVVVRDLNGQGSFRHVYRLSLAAPAADFALTLAADRFTLDAGASRSRSP